MDSDAKRFSRPFIQRLLAAVAIRSPAVDPAGGADPGSMARQGIRVEARQIFPVWTRLPGFESADEELSRRSPAGPLCPAPSLTVSPRRAASHRA
jgi:hypothetical protein